MVKATPAALQKERFHWVSRQSWIPSRTRMASPVRAFAGKDLRLRELVCCLGIAVSAERICWLYLHVERRRRKSTCRGNFGRRRDVGPIALVVWMVHVRGKRTYGSL